MRANKPHKPAHRDSQVNTRKYQICQREEILADLEEVEELD